jgi:hypothetical protein
VKRLDQITHITQEDCRADTSLGIKFRISFCSVFPFSNCSVPHTTIRLWSREWIARAIFRILIMTQLITRRALALSVMSAAMLAFAWNAGTPLLAKDAAKKSESTCIKTCVECAKVCKECSECCKVDRPECSKMCLTCHHMCAACAALHESNSKLAEEACVLCEKLCRECAASCKESKKECCKMCAEKCVACADACKASRG